MIISQNMKESGNEDDQWIPWEISYSLKEINRNDRRKTPNAIIAIVLAENNGSYDYYIEENKCYSVAGHYIREDCSRLWQKICLTL